METRRWARLANVRNRSKSIFLRLDRKSGGRLGILREALFTFRRKRATDAAASISFYAMFSLFPLLAVLVAAASLFVPRIFIINFLLVFLQPLFPVSSALLSENLIRFVEVRNTFGVISVLVLLFTGTTVFTLLANALSAAWENSKTRSFFHARLVGLALSGTIAALLMVFVVLTTLMDFFAHQQGLGPWTVINATFWRLLSRASRPMLAFGLFYILYRWVPRAQVRRRDASLSALVVALVWEVTARGFAWYLGSGFSRYDFLYGSLAGIAVLMIWIYLNMLILLFGAHFTSALGKYAQQVAQRKAEVGELQPTRSEVLDQYQ